MPAFFVYLNMSERINTYNEPGVSVIHGPTYGNVFQPYEGDLLANFNRDVLFGWDNLQPNRLMYHIAYSATAKNCVNRIAYFLNGLGFANPQSANMIVGDGYSAGELLSQICKDYALFEGFAIAISRMSDNNIRVKRLPFEYVRRAVHPGDEELYNIYSQLQTPEKIEVKRVAEDIPAFTPGGQELDSVHYAFIKGPNQEIYPMPSWSAAINDVISEAKLSQIMSGMLEKGLYPSAILSIPRVLNDTEKDGNGKTEKQRFQERIKGWQLKPGEVLVLESPNPENKVELIPYDFKPVVEGLQGARETLPLQICRAFGVSPIFAGIETPGKLGGSQQLQIEFDIMNVFMKPAQDFIKAQFEYLWPDVDWSIKPLNYFSTAPVATSTPAQL